MSAPTVPPAAATGRPPRSSSTREVPDPATGRTVTTHPMDPAAGITSERALFTTVAVLFPRPVDDDEAETAAGLFAYAWEQHGAPKHTGRVSDFPVLWPDEATMVLTAPMRQRPEQSRTRQRATADLVRDFLTYLSSGTPVRKQDGRQLVGPLPIDPQQVEIYTA